MNPSCKLVVLLTVIASLFISSFASAQVLRVPSGYQLEPRPVARVHPSRAMRILGEGLAWTGGAVVATGTGTVGFLVMAFNGGQQAAGALVLGAGIATGILGIPWLVWLAGGRDGSYWATVEGNLIGAVASAGCFGIMWTLAEASDSGVVASVAMVMAVALNMGGAILGFEWSRPTDDEHQRNETATLVPSVAPTPMLDGIMLGVAGAM